MADLYPKHVVTMLEYLPELFDEIRDLLCQKGTDYGPHNLSRFGELGILIRVSDKIDRLISMGKSTAAVIDETIEDTWKDIAGYALLALVERRKAQREKP